MAVKPKNQFYKGFEIDGHQVLATLEQGDKDAESFIQFRTHIKGLDLSIDLEIEQNKLEQAWQKVNLEQAENVFKTFNKFL